MARDMEPQVLNDSDRFRSARGPEPFVLPDFFDAACCRRIREAMDAGAAEPAEVLDDTIREDPDVRSATHLEVDPVTLAFVESRFDAVKPLIERYFGITLGKREGTGFLRYTPGDFFKPHTDSGDVPSWPAARRRRIALVLFLNTSTAADPSGTFSGGTLALHTEDDCGGVNLHPRMGTLVAFSADRVHEVTRVESGVRDALVDWFY